MTRTEWDNDEILERFHDWLAQTSQEIADLEDAGAMEPWADGDDLTPPPAALPETGLLQVVEALTAMRQELKLQTRNGRSLEEAVEAARQSLDVAKRQFQSVQAAKRRVPAAPPCRWRKRWPGWMNRWGGARRPLRSRAAN